jgi:hypothetical protein
MTLSIWWLLVAVAVTAVVVVLADIDLGQDLP